MNIATESEMIDFGAQLAALLRSKNYHILELIGDVGSGKTTLTKGIARALGIKEAVTSPSFMISKHYAVPQKTFTSLVHYDFYRLADPGIMSEDLSENLADPATLTIVEWGDSVADVLPENRLIARIILNDDASRTITLTDSSNHPISDHTTLDNKTNPTTTEPTL